MDDHSQDHARATRRGALECMLRAGTGLLWSVAGGLPRASLFVWPQSAAPGLTATRDGYNLIAWERAGLAFWAVSDLNPAELREFQQDFAEATAK